MLAPLMFPGVDVVSDEDLMREGGIEKFVERARINAGIVAG